jgi:hypothetical protein
MTNVEKRVAANKGLIEIVVVIDVNDCMDVTIARFRKAVAAQAGEPLANEQFSNRFTHYCNGGLTMLQERAEFDRLIMEESCGTIASVEASIAMNTPEQMRRYEQACEDWERREAARAMISKARAPN